MQLKRPENSWKLIKRDQIEADNITQYEEIAKEYGFSKVLLKLMLNRKITEPEEMEFFLNPTWDNLHDPFQINDMDKGASRLLKAIDTREKILIYGDYDVDGVTAVVLLYDFIEQKGGKVEYIIPDRFEEGYGLSLETLTRLQFTPDLIITVDCGINSVLEVSELAKEGIDFIITDHHEQLDSLPPAWAVINPKRDDSKYPFKELSGVGVVFKLVWACMMHQGEDSLKESLRKYLDLVALGTIADLVPLVDENRFFVMKGLADFGANRLGLKALNEESGLTDKDINVGNIAFMVAPRINAAGRLDTAGKAVELLLESNSLEKARQLAKELSKENKDRQELEKEVYEEAKKEIIERGYLDTDKVLVLAKEGWHEGVIGIAASKLVEEFYRPVILLSTQEGEAKGSCRSIPSFDMITGLSRCHDCLSKYGGHTMAAGLTIEVEKIDSFRKKINEHAFNELSVEDLTPSINIDIDLPSSRITYELAKELDLLAPYGIGNPKPVISSVFFLDNLRKVGQEKEHIKLSFYDGESYYNGIWFNGTSRLPFIRKEAPVKVAFNLSTNEYRGESYLDLQVKDIKQEEVESCTIDYRNLNKKSFLNRFKKNGTVLVNTLNHKKILDAEPGIGDRYDIIRFSRAFQEHEGNYCKDNNLILFDLPYDGEAIKEIIDRLSVSQVYLLYSREDKDRNGFLWQSTIPTRVKIDFIYNKLSNLDDNGRLEEGKINDSYNAGFFGNVTWRLISKCLDILIELELLKTEKSNYILETGLDTLSERMNLNTSKTYMEEVNRLNKIKWWENFFLSSNPAVIYQFLFDNLDKEFL